MVNLPHNFNDICERYNSVLENLSTISDISKDDKLFIHKSKLIIQPYSSTRSFVRWWNKYNRNDCVDFIEELYTNISSLNIQLVSLVSLSKKVTSNNKKKKRNKIRQANYYRKLELLNKCKDTKSGLRHLMITYKNDQKFVDSINTVLNMIDKMD
tara:strand:- start:1454 stop:1918 length:465 start_codon:yes stop_codon:yes gene_type:complete